MIPQKKRKFPDWAHGGELASERADMITVTYVSIGDGFKS